jgi:hypothetical protein
MQPLQSGDFRSHDERLDGDLYRVALLAAEQSHAARFLQPLELDLANGLRDSSGRARLGGLTKYLGRRLQAHGLVVQSIAFFELE